MRLSPLSAMIALLPSIAVCTSPGGSFSGKIWAADGRPVSTPAPPLMMSASPLSWPPPPGARDYAAQALTVKFGPDGAEFEFLLYPSPYPGEYWVAQLRSAGRSVQGATAAREGRLFTANPALMERFLAGPGLADWEPVIEACAEGAPQKIKFLKSLPRSHSVKEVMVSPKANPSDLSSPSTFPARELHLLRLTTGEILEGIIPTQPQGR